MDYSSVTTDASMYDIHMRVKVKRASESDIFATMTPIKRSKRHASIEALKVSFLNFYFSSW
jgi:hypothetical protein